MHFSSSAFSDIGRLRTENEDSFLCDDRRRLYAVADGIGGLPAGAQASQLAIAALDELIPATVAGEEQDYETCLHAINSKVYELGRLISERVGIGTTLVFGHVVGDKLHVTHVGDSILLRFREGIGEQLTTDHNIENEARIRLARGEAIGMVFENRQALTRCVGQPPPLQGDFLTFEVEPGDRYLFCSDGITRMMSINDIGRRLVEARDPAGWVRSLVELANERGGYDNSTAIGVYCD